MTADEKHQMLVDYQAGNTLQKIGDAHGITRERVRQIITRFPEYHEAKIAKRRKPHAVGNCEYCHAPIIRLLSYPVPKTCSPECRKALTAKRRVNRLITLKEKRCSRCGHVKPISEFFFNKSQYVFYPACKKCHTKLTLAWKEKHPRKAKAMQRKASRKRYDILRSTPEGREQIRELGRKYYHRYKHTDSYKKAQCRSRARYLKRLASTPEGRATLKRWRLNSYMRRRASKRPYKQRITTQ